MAVARLLRCAVCLAVPGRVVSIDDEDPIYRSGKVDFAGNAKRVNLAYVPEAGVGDYVLVHVGVAIGKVDEIEAGRIFEYLRRLGELAEFEAGEAQ